MKKKTTLIISFILITCNILNGMNSEKKLSNKKRKEPVLTTHTPSSKKVKITENNTNNYEAALNYYNHKNFELAKEKFIQAYKDISPAQNIEGKVELITILSYLAYIANAENNASVERDYLISASFILANIETFHTDILHIKKRTKKAEIKRFLEQIKNKYQILLTGLYDQENVTYQLHKDIEISFQKKLSSRLEAFAIYLEEFTIPKSIISCTTTAKSYIYCSDYFLRTFQNNKAKYFWEKGLSLLKQAILLDTESNTKEQQIQQYCNRLLGEQIIKNSHLFGKSFNVIEANTYITHGYPNIKPTQETLPYHPITKELLEYKRKELNDFLQL